MSILLYKPENPNDFLQWDRFISGHPEGSVFQSPQMHHFWNKVDHFEPVAFLAKDADQQIVGAALAVNISEPGWLRNKFSSRTVMYGGPLVSPSHPDFKAIHHELLSKIIRAVTGKTIFFQVRNFFDTSEIRDQFTRCSFRYAHRLNLLVDTTSGENVQNGMSKSRIRQIRKSLNAGAIIVEPVDESEIEEFYLILKHLYQHKVRKPLPSYSFFREFYRATIQNQLGIIRLIKFREKIVGGIVCPVTPGQTIYEMYVCGLDEQYEPDGIYPSVLATWAPIEYAMMNHIPSFDFMGVGIPGRAYGVRDFKMRFGGTTVNYGRYARVNNQLIYVISEIGYNILSFFGKV